MALNKTSYNLDILSLNTLTEKCYCSLEKSCCVIHISLFEKLAAVTKDVAVACFFFSDESIWRSPRLFLWVGKCHKYSVNRSAGLGYLCGWTRKIPLISVPVRTSKQNTPLDHHPSSRSLCTLVSRPLIGWLGCIAILCRFSVLPWPFS